MNARVPLTARQKSEAIASVSRIRRDIDAPGFRRDDCVARLLSELGLMHSAHDCEDLKSPIRHAFHALGQGDRDTAVRALADYGR